MQRVPSSQGSRNETDDGGPVHIARSSSAMSQQQQDKPAAQAASAETKVDEEDREDVLKGINSRILHFSPSWFSITMGTGIPATLLLSLPYHAVSHALRPVAAFFLILDTVLFVLFSVAICTRYIKYPAVFALTITHPTHSMFLGTIPMSMLTIESGIIDVTQSYGMSFKWVYAVSYLWWMTLAVTITTALLVPFVAFTKQKNALDQATAVLLLPVVPAITQAAIGGGLADLLMDSAPHYAYNIWLCSYVVLGCGLPLALIILSLYFQRLILHHIPTQEMIVSSFLPLGPTGLAGFSLVKLGKVALTVLPAVDRTAGGDGGRAGLLAGGMYGSGVAGAVLMWGLGNWFMIIAIASFYRRCSEGLLVFNMGWWGLTFPLASLTLSTLILGTELQSPAFDVIGTIFTFSMIALWAIVFVPTVRGAIKGSKVIFAAPCVSNFKRSESAESAMESFEMEER